MTTPRFNEYLIENTRRLGVQNLNVLNTAIGTKAETREADERFTLIVSRLFLLPGGEIDAICTHWGDALHERNPDDFTQSDARRNITSAVHALARADTIPSLLHSAFDYAHQGPTGDFLLDVPYHSPVSE